MVKNLRWLGRFVVLCAAMLMVCTPLPSLAQSGSAQGDRLIVPGERVGAIHIGMSERELYALLGAPASTYRNPDDSTAYTFKNGAYKLLVTTDEGAVYKVGVTDPSFHTAEGVHPGSPLLELRARLGKADCEEAIPTSPPMLMSIYGQVSYVVINGVVTEINTKRTRFHCD